MIIILDYHINLYNCNIKIYNSPNNSRYQKDKESMAIIV